MSDEGFGQIPELRQSTIDRELRRLEDARLRRRGLLAKPRELRKFKSADPIGGAFARAELEQRELLRLKASGAPYACLDFHPQRLAPDLSSQNTPD